jgi:hypothetical protein
MNAATQLHLSSRDDFPVVPVKACKGLNQFLQPPGTVGADTGNPGK